MFTRRHIRIKVMQAVYALHKDPEQSFTAVRKKFDKQLLAAYDLYFVMYALLIAIHQSFMGSVVLAALTGLSLREIG